MALINCPECGIEVSEKAIACPKCGCPIVSSAHDSEPNMGSEKKEIEEPLFPTFPTVMNVGKQIVNWSMKAALPNCYYLSELNATKYLKDGKVDVLAHSNGICILCYSDTTSFYISHDQIIDMKFTTHRQIIEQKKSVLKRAAVGGLLLGPTAAIIGGLSGLGTKTATLGEYLFIINFWDIYSHKAQSIVLCSKIEGVGFVEKVNEEKTKHNVAEGNNYICNIIDDDGNISEGKTIDALKIVGKIKLAQQVQLSQQCGMASAIQKINEICDNKKIDSSKYKSSGCIVALLLITSGMAGLLSLTLAILI